MHAPRVFIDRTNPPKWAHELSDRDSYDRDISFFFSFLFTFEYRFFFFFSLLNIMFYNTNVTHSFYSFYRELITFAWNITLNELIIREEKLSDDYSERNECTREVSYVLLTTRYARRIEVNWSPPLTCTLLKLSPTLTPFYPWRLHYPYGAIAAWIK